MRICLSLFLAASVVLFSYGASAQFLPRIASIHFFCVAPAAITDIADALTIGNNEAEQVASEYVALKMCVISNAKLPVLATSEVKTFVLADGQSRTLYEASLPTGRLVWFIGPVIGDPT